MKQWLVFTDLDGSLLDHHTYSYKAAEPVLAKLKADHIPVIFTTSKTRLEVIALRKKMKNHHPFIVENGAAVIIPSDYFPVMPKDCFEDNDYWIYEFSEKRQHWLALLDKTHSKYGQSYKNFAAMTDKELSQATKLSIDAAKLANEREYSEPIQWLGSETDKASFIAELETLEGTVQQGGRFLNLSGDNDKARALSWLIEQFIAFSVPCELSTLALGDSQNDVAMLEVADYACVIRSPVHAPPKLNRNASYLISEHFGPKGWAQGVEKLIYQ